MVTVCDWWRRCRCGIGGGNGFRGVDNLVAGVLLGGGRRLWRGVGLHGRGRRVGGGRIRCRRIGGARCRGLRRRCDLSVELETFSLIQHLPKGAIKVAESGVKPDKIREVARMWYDAVLVGTSLLKASEGVEKMLREFEQAMLPPSQAN